LTIHIEFLRRTSAGPGIFTVQDLKLGSTISTVRISLSQLDASNNYRQEVVAFVSHTNLLRANGITLDGRHTWPDIVSSPSVDLAQLERAGEDENWVPLRLSEKTREFAKAVSHVQIYVPRSRYQQIPPSASRRAVDEWLRFTPQGAPETFVNDSLGYVADKFPLLLESFMPEGNKEELQFWTATLSLSLEVKKLLPSPLSHKSAEWLFLRAESKSVQNGRMDIEMTILDQRATWLRLVLRSLWHSMLHGTLPRERRNLVICEEGTWGWIPDRVARYCELEEIGSLNQVICAWQVARFRQQERQGFRVARKRCQL
jgi:hypothetical protein